MFLSNGKKRIADTKIKQVRKVEINIFNKNLNDDIPENLSKSIFVSVI